MKNEWSWVWLQSVLGCGSQRVLPVLEYFGTPKAVYDASEADLRASRLFAPAEILKHRTVTRTRAEHICRLCSKNGFVILPMDHPDYPRRLLRMMDPPAVLYVKGTLPVVDDEVCIAMVGTRKATKDGMEIARRLAYRLGKAGAVIVSGGAYGVDTACLDGGLAAGAKTICVMGCGLDMPCFEENRAQRNQVTKLGAVVSEFPPGFKAARYTFPMRNRLVSALSLGAVIIEAPAKSGALITARTALEQGRDVFVVAGNPLAAAYAGSNRLLQDGALPVYTPMDILSEYAATYPHRLDLRGADIPLGEDDQLINGTPSFFRPDVSETTKVLSKEEASADSLPLQQTIFSKPVPPDGISPAAQAIYNTIDSPVMSFDAMTARSGLPVHMAARAVTELELLGVLQAIPGGKYQWSGEGSSNGKGV